MILCKTLSCDLPLTIDTKNWFHIAIRDYNLNEISYDEFGKLKYIDSGAFGNVYWTSCKSIQNEKVAAKEIHIPEEDDEKKIRMFLNELKLHCQVSHPRIIQFYGISNDYRREAYFILMEYAEGGTLRKYLKTAKLSWKKKVELAIQM
ncbi:29499_t:CDS:2, partial [Racocetra persica]